MDLYIM